MLIHSIDPVYNCQSRILLLGSFPSVQSRAKGFYYAHPQNRFWKVMTEVLSWPCLPVTIWEKKELLLGSRVALWDVIASCRITGSSDSSIRNAVPNDLTILLDNSSINSVFCTGGKAYELYNKWHRPRLPQLPVYKLPSTSGANASYDLNALCASWAILQEKLKNSREELQCDKNGGE